MEKAERVPLFLLRGGRLVREDGPRQWTPFTRSPEESATKIKAAAKPDAFVYVYDVDGVEARAPDVTFYQRLERLHVPLWLHPGCRRPEDAMDAFFAGAERLTVDLADVGEPGLRELADLAEGELHVGLGFRARSPVPDRRPFELKRLAEDTQLSGFVVDPEPGTDGHHLGAFGAELRRHGLSTTLLVRRAIAGIPPDAFDRRAEAP